MGRPRLHDRECSFVCLVSRQHSRSQAPPCVRTRVAVDPRHNRTIFLREEPILRFLHSRLERVSYRLPKSTACCTDERPHHSLSVRSSPRRNRTARKIRQSLQQISKPCGSFLAYGCLNGRLSLVPAKSDLVGSNSSKFDPVTSPNSKGVAWTFLTNPSL